MNSSSTPQHNINDEELRNLFAFLGGEANKENLKSTNVIFGLENYALPISPENIKVIKAEIKRKAKDGHIAYEDFKSLWSANIDLKVPAKDMALHFFNIMTELLENTPQVKEVIKNDPNFKLEKINKAMLEDLLTMLSVMDETPEQEEEVEDKTASLNRRSVSVKKKVAHLKMSVTSSNMNAKVETENVKTVAKEMIDILDSDEDQCITIKDFEFVINEYLNHIKK